MNEELKKQIEQEAEDYAIKIAWINKEQIDSQLFYEYIAKTSFRAGVTSHIIRAITAEQENEILREALKQISVTNSREEMRCIALRTINHKLTTNGATHG